MHFTMMDEPTRNIMSIYQSLTDEENPPLPKTRETLFLAILMSARPMQSSIAKTFYEHGVIEPYKRAYLQKRSNPDSGPNSEYPIKDSELLTILYAAYNRSGEYGVHIVTPEILILELLKKTNERSLLDDILAEQFRTNRSDLRQKNFSAFSLSILDAKRKELAQCQNQIPRKHPKHSKGGYMADDFSI